MTPEAALKFIIKAEGNASKAANAMGVSRQRVHNWIKDGVSAEGRPYVWLLANKHGARLPASWLKAPKKDAA
jgi:DNA invertase Pin-like site-specific DNA recombinase